MKSIMHNFWNLLTIISTIALIGSANAADPLKVGFVYVGPIGDHGWTYEHDQSRLALEKAFGSKVKTTYLEKIPEGPDAERAIQQLARTGHDIIFSTSSSERPPEDSIFMACSFPVPKSFALT